MIILASGSPRRKEILNSHGIDPKIIKPEVDETIPSGFSEVFTPEQTVLFLSLQKGLWVYNNLKDHERSEHKQIISADTIVYDQKILGKPNDLDEATDFLLSLKNKWHKVLTGVTVIQINTGHATMFCDTSKVYFKDYTLDHIKEYHEESNPLDKAGGYAIQSSWKKHVDHIEGDLENIIGLPFYRIEPLISK